MHPTRNDLSQQTRKAVVALLQPRLAAALDLSLQAKQAHWNVKGPHFAPLHALFDAIYEHAGDHADELAERIVQLGGTAEGTLQAVAKATSLAPYPLDATSGRAHLEATTNALAVFGRSVREGIEDAAKLGDADTADLFTEISRAADKDLWMVEAHLHGDS
jgi:starvation-inducible DNA-binding protein